MRFRSRALTALLFGLFLQVTEAAPATTTQTFLIEGHPYTAVLTPNNDLPSSLGAERVLMRGAHFSGHLKEAPDSWLRVSRIDGAWQGLVYLNGHIEVIQPDSTTPRSTSIARALGDEPASCGLDDVVDTPMNTRSGLALPRAADLDYTTLCDSTVGGLCMLSELEVVFDSAFQQRFPDTYPDQAVSILNMVEGYYEDALDIGFDTLTMDFPSQEYFSASTDANVFLEAIQSTKPSLDIIENDQSLMHVVTGRDFDGSTVGVAYIGVLCNSAFDVGTSQIVRGDMALTALTMAHELGHNFGASHDNSSCGDGYVMSASLTTDAYNQGFSSCSQTEMRSVIDRLTEPQACFNFPADARITPSADNPSQVKFDTDFTLSYDIQIDRAYLSADTLTVTGGIDPDQGRLIRAQLGNQACTLSDDSTGYHCTLSNPTASAALIVDAAATAESAQLTHDVSVAQSTGDLTEIHTDDNQAITTVSVDTLDQPSDLSVTVSGADIQLSWTDRSSSESGYAVRRRLDGDTVWTAINDSLPVDAATFTDTTAAFDTRYEYQVQAQPVDNGQGSNIVTIENPTPPQPRADLSADATTDRIDLSWTDTDDFETALWLARQRSGSGEWLTLDAELPADTTAYSDTTVVAGEQYRYRLTAYNSLHEADPVLTGDIGLVSTTDESGADASTEDDRLASGGGSLLWFAMVAVVAGIRRHQGP